MARKIWFMAKHLAAIGGTDYTSDIATLRSDANALTCGMSPDDMATAAAVVEYNNAVAAGASVSSTPSALASDVKCLDDQPDHALEQMELLLRCKLGRAQGYPQ
jgi:hypothetical protein